MKCFCSHWVALCVCLLLLPVLSSAGADNDKLAVGLIDKQLLVNADAVIRRYDLDMQLTPVGEVLVKKYIAVTVLSEKGMQYAFFAEDFSKLKKIRKIEGTVYDQYGNTVNHLKSSDFISTSRNPETGAYSDDKILFYMCPKRSFPFTVVFSVETKQNHTFLIPDFFPQQGDGCAVEAASLSVTVPKGQQLRYKSIHTSVAAVQSEAADAHIYTWQIQNMPAVTTEPLCRNGYYDRTGILLAAANFRLGDYEGRTDTWQDIGRFIYGLNKGRDILPDAERLKITQLVSGVSSTQDTIQILYKYLQDNFRYVAVEYGIGGWQTMDANFLAKNRYGDCKALTNYMMSMLHTVGITAYPVLINAGVENKSMVLTDFPAPNFNHVILCIPAVKDTLWLECTSNELPAGYLSDFTQDRTGLMITPDGGRLVHTPVYDTVINSISRHAVVRLLSEDKLHVVLENGYTGQPAVMLHHQVNNKSAHDLDMLLEEKYSLPGYTVTAYNYKRTDRNGLMGMTEHMEMDVSNMATMAAGRMLINLDVAPIKITLPVTVSERKRPFYIPGSYVCNDTFEYTIPAGMSVADMPAPVSLSFPFGNYRCTVTSAGDRLVVNRSFVQKSGNYSAALYGSYEAFIEKITHGRQLRAVLLNK